MTRITEDWLTDPGTQAVCAALEAGGAQALFVGGCVRNALMGVPVSDIDISTDARPERVIALAEAAGIKAVPTGIDHGTVTLVEHGVPHEVTTFRRDVSTDGRRAVVAFAERIEEDAARRDFTMNAIYARSDGTVIDPLGGLPDLYARRVRFIGEPRDRIREDYLRSLRYFRFHAWYGDDAEGFDPEALSAIAENLDGLSTLSRERVGAELLRLLAAPDPAPSVAAMRSTGALGQLLPGADDRALAPLVHLEQTIGAAPDGLRRLAALGGIDVPARLRMSRARARRFDQMREAAAQMTSPAELGYRLKQPAAGDALLLRCAWGEQPWPEGASAALEQGAAARFPLTAGDLMPAYKGAALGARLAELETAWIASGFALDREALLSGDR
ncbi:CCA tRNA nucleotidyltransferase [Pseudodonghicola flavimaris]|uniref:CCA tRNA nucleotidyltransferase n=1 Tax=Pseudodonghicola flavimaris TaxID=3050036 RepID=A0ABT7EZW4_9RHOB|nr:CCA tRNA nucleotidyltransferase [Pseudodonghicola flavimaris]MDK3017882.1 CCA tRNA nucleotidyltransferase [Pseudodonghicola flavimaris]